MMNFDFVCHATERSVCVCPDYFFQSLADRERDVWDLYPEGCGCDSQYWQEEGVNERRSVT